MDNAMVKRGIGAVVLAIIAALLLGFLLKDKSRDRQDAIKTELSIPALSDATEKVTDTTATLVDEAKETVSNAGSNVVASATASLNTITDGASTTLEAVTDDVTNTADSATKTVGDAIASTDDTTSANDTSNPGFSFRPPTQNEEQKINTDSADNSTVAENSTTDNSTASNNQQVVASAPKKEKKVEKEFKPTIENEPKKVAKKATKKVEKKKTVAKKKPAEKKAKPAAANKATSGGKYSIQLLATSSQSRAKKLADTMKSEGYVSHITQTTSNNKILYRVRVGDHQDRNAALEAQQSMKRRYQKNFFVQNSLVVSK